MAAFLFAEGFGKDFRGIASPDTDGQGDASVVFYAPVTRIDGITWIHPAWAKEYTWAEITLRAARIWRISGSLWNPVAFRLIWRGEPNFFAENEPPAVPGRQP